jgi:hypothetical protein
MMKEKHRHRRENDLKALTDLITLLDCYRVNRYVQLDSMEKAVKSGKLEKFDVKWREMRRILYKIGGLPNLSASINKLVKIREGVKAIEIIGSYLFAFGLGVFVLSYFKVCPEWLQPAYVYVGLPALIVLLGTRLTTEFINRKIALEIEELSKSHSKKFRFLRARLRDIAQDLINRLGKHIKDRHEDADKYRIDLYNTDYKRIKILKSPGTLRKHYTVVCKT